MSKEKPKYCHECPEYSLDTCKQDKPEYKGKHPGVCRITGKEILGIRRYCGGSPLVQETEEHFCNEREREDLSRCCRQEPNRFLEEITQEDDF